MKKIFIYISIPLTFLLLAGCYKTIEKMENDNNTLVLAYPAVQNYNASSSGLKFFNKALVELKNTATDTFYLQAIIKAPVSNNLTVSIAADDAALAAYNNDTSNHVRYIKMPAANYTIVTPTVTIPAGQTSATVKIAIKPQQFDISQTGYMLPVSITGDPGIGISQDFKTVYLHVERDPTPPYDRTGWVVTGYDSQEPTEQNWAPYPQGLAIAVLDGQPDTFWHSAWANSQPAFPHWISFDMLTAKTIHGIYFLERQYTADDKVKGVTVATSNNGTTWTDAASFNLENTTAWQKISITPVGNVRYFKVTFTSNFSGKPWTNMAEIKPF